MSDERTPVVFVGRVKAKAMAMNGERQYKPTDLNSHIPPGVFPMIQLTLTPDDLKLLESRMKGEKPSVTILLKKSRNKDTWYGSVDTWEPKHTTPQSGWGQSVQQSQPQPQQQPSRQHQAPSGWQNQQQQEPAGWNTPEPPQGDIPF